LLGATADYREGRRNNGCDHASKHTSGLMAATALLLATSEVAAERLAKLIENW
jgi:hypothetical protein